jgi:hypothetical protein
MSYANSQQQPRYKRSATERAEEQAWVSLYRQVRTDAGLAAEVVAHLEADTVSKQRHLALYLSSRQALLAHKARQHRDQRIALFVSWVGRSLFVAPWRGLRRLGNIAVDCLPGNAAVTAVEPACNDKEEPGSGKVGVVYPIKSVEPILIVPESAIPLRDDPSTTAGLSSV